MAKHHKIISNKRKRDLTPLEKRYDTFGVRCIIAAAILLWVCHTFSPTWVIYFNGWVPFIVAIIGALFGLPVFYLIRKYLFKFVESFGTFLTDFVIIVTNGFLSAMLFGTLFYYSFEYINAVAARQNELKFERCKVYSIDYHSGKGARYAIKFRFLGRDEYLFRYNLGPHMTEVYQSGKYADSHFDLYYRKGLFDSYVIEDHSFEVK